MWYNERINKRQVSAPPEFSMCCMHGKIELPPPPQLPQAIIDLLINGDTRRKHFRENIRAYNSMFAFTSMGGKVDTSINKGRGHPVFRLLGQNYHGIGSLLPLDDSRPKFQQLYIFDTVNENANRIAAFRFVILLILQNKIRYFHIYYIFLSFLSFKFHY